MAEIPVVKARPTDIEVAVDWLVRLQRPSVTQADWLAFDDWLAASEHHAKAYDAALTLDLQLAGYVPETDPSVATPPQKASAPEAVHTWLWPALGTLAASLLIGIGLFMNSHVHLPIETVYSTGTGAHKTVVLSDGTSIALNTESRLAVHFDPTRRHVRMADAEAYFDVAKDPRRPFVIDAGASQVRVVGTAFDVKSRDGQLLVAVERGIVDVQPGKSSTAKRYRLIKGQALAYSPNSGLVQVRLIENGDAASWRSGRLIYRDQPLSDVVADLNRQFDKPVRLGDARTGNMRLTGLLIVDTQANMLKRLSALLPLKISDKGDLIVLETR